MRTVFAAETPAAETPLVRTWLQLLSFLALVGGLFLAVYYFALPFWLSYQAAGRAAADPNHVAFWQSIDKTDRLTGVIFGFGLAFLGAFGLYAERDKPARIRW